MEYFRFKQTSYLSNLKVSCEFIKSFGKIVAMLDHKAKTIRCVASEIKNISMKHVNYVAFRLNYKVDCEYYEYDKGLSCYFYKVDNEEEKNLIRKEIANKFIEIYLN